MEVGAIVAEKRVSCPKSDNCKNFISGSQGRWALGFCMEATQSLKSLYQQGFGFEAQEKYFHTSTLRAHQKWEKLRQCEYWDIYTYGASGPI